MFDLEQSITEWRQQMLAAGIKTPVPLEELEIHLREEIGRRMKTGVDESRAFKIAAQQIGPPDALKREFKNVLEVEKSKHISRRFSQSVFVISAFASLILLLIQILKPVFPAYDAAHLSSQFASGQSLLKFYEAFAAGGTREWVDEYLKVSLLLTALFAWLTFRMAKPARKQCEN